jgi:hypothetical protein
MAATAQEQIIAQMAGTMIENKTGLIKGAISKALGTQDWTLCELRHRLHQVIFNGSKEVFFLDGKEIIRFYPLEFIQGTKDHVTTLKAEQKFR